MIDIMWPIVQITHPYILFILIGMIFIHCFSCVIFTMNSMSICSDLMNYHNNIINYQ